VSLAEAALPADVAVLPSLRSASVLASKAFDLTPSHTGCATEQARVSTGHAVNWLTPAHGALVVSSSENVPSGVAGRSIESLDGHWSAEVLEGAKEAISTVEFLVVV